jgi:hypothetical protein
VQNNVTQITGNYTVEVLWNPVLGVPVPINPGHDADFAELYIGHAGTGVAAGAILWGSVHFGVWTTGATRIAGYTRPDLIRFGKTVVPKQLIEGPGATGAVVTRGLKGGGRDLPFHYHIHRYNWYKPWEWFKYTETIKPPK